MTVRDNLSVEIVDGRLVISIGLEMLSTAILAGPYFEDEALDGTVISNQQLFAEAIVYELKNESDDGSTLVHKMFDKAAEQAIENGAEGIHIPEDGEDGEKS